MRDRRKWIDSGGIRKCNFPKRITEKLESHYDENDETETI